MLLALPLPSPNTTRAIGQCFWLQHKTKVFSSRSWQRSPALTGHFRQRPTGALILAWTVWRSQRGARWTLGSPSKPPATWPALERCRCVQTPATDQHGTTGIWDPRPDQHGRTGIWDPQRFRSQGLRCPIHHCRRIFSRLQPLSTSPLCLKTNKDLVIY